MPQNIPHPSHTQNLSIYVGETHVDFVERAMRNIGHYIATTNNAILLINKHVGSPRDDFYET